MRLRTVLAAALLPLLAMVLAARGEPRAFAPEGTPIRAADQGLAYPLADPARYGNYVLVQERAGYATVYGHMVRTNTSWGQPVQAGDVIGWVGTTGNSSGPHLHFEVRFGGAPQNPLPYLQGSPPDPYPVPEGWPGAPLSWRHVSGIRANCAGIWRAIDPEA